MAQAIGPALNPVQQPDANVQQPHAQYDDNMVTRPTPPGTPRGKGETAAQTAARPTPETLMFLIQMDPRVRSQCGGLWNKYIGPGAVITHAFVANKIKNDAVVRSMVILNLCPYRTPQSCSTRCS